MSSSSWLQQTSDDIEPPFTPVNNTRSTIDLVKTCLVSLFLCSWTSIHLDIPGKSDRGRRLRTMCQKVQWTIAGILFPELMFWMAFVEFWEARWLCFELEKLKEPESQRGRGGDIKREAESQATITVNEIKSEITVIDAPTAVGDVCRKCGSSKCATPTSTPMDNANINHPVVESRLSRFRRQRRKYRELFKLPIYPKRLEVGFYIEMGGLEIDVVEDPSNAATRPVTSSEAGKVTPQLENVGSPDREAAAVTGRVTTSGALFLDRERLFPPMDIAQINDQSKSDILAKILVCAQATWMVLQCIARAAMGLPLCLLELNTIMHVICMLLIYGMWFKKPQDVRFPKIITPANATRGLTCQQIKELKQHLEPLERSGSIQLNSTKSSIAEVSIFIGAMLGLITSGIYGGVHLAAWHAHFPSQLEKDLWRISGCIIVGMPVFLMVFLLMLKLVRDAANNIQPLEGFGKWEVTAAYGWTYRRKKDMESPRPGIHPKAPWNLYKHHSGFIHDLIDNKKWIMLAVYIVLVALQTIAAAIYFSARAYVVIESFLSLRSLPKGVYTQIWWVELVPHF